MATDISLKMTMRMVCDGCKYLDTDKTCHRHAPAIRDDGRGVWPRIVRGLEETCGDWEWSGKLYKPTEEK